MSIKTQLAAAMSIIFGSLPLAAFGHGGGGDIALYTTNGQVDVGFATLDDDDDQQIFFDPTDRVHQAVLTTLTGQPDFIPWEIGSSEPGFDSDEGALPGGALISFNVLSIRHWDGSGEPEFAATNAVTGGYAPQPDSINQNGGYHRHPTFGFSDATDDGQPIADGVYLTELSISVDGLRDSNTFYLLALVDSTVNSQANPIAAAEQLGLDTRNYLADPSIGAPTLDGENFAFFADAISHVESIAVPEPTAAVLGLFALAGLARRRR